MKRSIFFIPILLVVALAMLAIMPVLQSSVSHVSVKPVEFENGVAVSTGGHRVVDVDNDHAWAKHGAEAIAALRCLEDKGPALTYREPDKGPVHLLCLGDDGKWYDVIIEYLRKGKIRLKSAFSPQNETANQANAIRTWLEGKGATTWRGGPSSIEYNWITPKPW
jgi:hypothetical protein